MVPLTKSPMIVRHAEALAVVMVYGVRAALRHQAGAGHLIHLLQARANVQGSSSRTTTPTAAGLKQSRGED